MIAPSEAWPAIHEETLLTVDQQLSEALGSLAILHHREAKAYEVECIERITYAKTAAEAMDDAPIELGTAKNYMSILSGVVGALNPDIELLGRGTALVTYALYDSRLLTASPDSEWTAQLTPEEAINLKAAALGVPAKTTANLVLPWSQRGVEGVRQKLKRKLDVPTLPMAASVRRAYEVGLFTPRSVPDSE